MQTYLGIGAGSLLVAGLTLTAPSSPSVPKLRQDGPSVQRTFLYSNGTTGKEFIRLVNQYSDGTSQVRKLTSETIGRWLNPRLSPDGQTVLATLIQGGVKKVALIPISQPSAFTVFPNAGSVANEDASWSPDGTRVVLKRTTSFAPYAGEIVEVDRNGANPNVITTSALFDGLEASMPSYSLNDGGRRIAFQSFYPDKTGGPFHEQIFVVNRSTKTPKKLTAGPTRSWSPAWSPTSNAIVFVKNDVGEIAKLWQVDAGSLAQTLVNVPEQQGIDAGTDLIDPSFSPNGWLAFSARTGFSDGNGVYRLFSLSPDGFQLDPLVGETLRNLRGADYVTAPFFKPSDTVYAWSGPKEGNFVIPDGGSVEGNRVKVIGGKDAWITSLGFEYHSATQPPGPVGIFDGNSKLLYQVDVANTDVLSNGYLYKSIPPFRLQAGKEYIIAALHLNGPAWGFYHDRNVAQTPSFIQDLGSCYKPTTTLDNDRTFGSNARRCYLGNFRAYQAP
ncbi:hypothetical protein EON79_11855 [bacterium]|nr:MAG: hypothetical protein EON79_11855 [bacterium]